MENISIGEIIICGGLIFLFGVFWFCILSPTMQHEQFVKDAPKITKEINITNIDNYNSGISLFLITDSNGDKYIINTFDIDMPSFIYVDKKYNITYYCNENDNRVIISAVDISPKPVDRLKCVNVSGRCE